MKIIRSGVGVGVGLGVIALTLAGCAGSSDPAPTAPEETTSLKVVVAPVFFESAYVAQWEGIFRDEGLDVEIVPGGAATQNVAIAVGGEAQIVIGSWGTPLTSAAQGLGLSVVAGNSFISPDHPTSALIVPDGSDITDVTDIAGRTVGITGLNTGYEVPLYYAAEAAGTPHDSFERVELAAAGMATALDGGTVDAVFASEPFMSQLVGAGNRVISYPSMDHLPNAPGTVWVATNEWLADSGEVAARFNAAMGRAIEYYNDPDNADAVLDITAEVSGSDRATLSAASLAPLSLVIDVPAAQKLRDGCVEFDVAPDVPESEAVLWADAPQCGWQSTTADAVRNSRAASAIRVRAARA